jgi:hypothetical protein
MTHIEKARKLRKVIEGVMASVDDKTSSEAVELLPTLKYDGSLIKAGTRINYNGKVKKATVDLWDTPVNNPDNVPNLWEEIQYKDGYRLIPETFNVTNAFSKGEIGWWKGELYKSLVDNNVYTPSEYARNWEKWSE